jgi:hypothetical protein
VRRDPHATAAFEAIAAARSLEDLYARLGLEHIIEPTGIPSRCATGSYDLIFSFHVLEHVPAARVGELLGHFQRMLRPGGVMIHQIGIDDHLAHYDAKQSPKTYLQYSDRTWRRFFENDVQYFNRLQRSEWLRELAATVSSSARKWSSAPTSTACRSTTASRIFRVSTSSARSSQSCTASRSRIDAAGVRQPRELGACALKAACDRRRLPRSCFWLRCCVSVPSPANPQQDDAYITYRYARNLVTGHGFAYNPGEHVLGTTTPLFTLLLALLAKAGVPFEAAGPAVGVVCDLVLCFLLWRAFARRGPAWLGWLWMLFYARSTWRCRRAATAWSRSSSPSW